MNEKDIDEVVKNVAEEMISDWACSIPTTIVTKHHNASGFEPAWDEEYESDIDYSDLPYYLQQSLQEDVEEELDSHIDPDIKENSLLYNSLHVLDLKTMFEAVFYKWQDRHSYEISESATKLATPDY